MKTMAWPMEAHEIMRVFRAIQFKYFKWDIFHRGKISILPEALVLSAEEHHTLVEAAEAVWAALRTVEDVVRRDVELLKAVAVPETLREATVAQRDENPRVTRCDFHLTEDGRWLISEFNDDGPSGFGECAGLSGVLMDEWAHRFEGVTFKGDLRGAIEESLSEWPRIGLVHATSYSEDLQHVALVEEWLQQQGHETVLGSPANLRVEEGEGFLFDTQIDALFRYYPGEWLGDLPNADAWCEAAAFLPQMNPLSAIASQSKRFYASWEEHDIALSETERGWLDKHLPKSLYLGKLTKEEVLKNPEKWVLKGSYGRMGNTVRIGPLMPKEKWEKAVQEAFEVPHVVAAQERFDTAALWTSKGMGFATVGVYLVDGRFAGYFSRIDKGPLIDYDSWHVPTLVEIS